MKRLIGTIATTILTSFAPMHMAAQVERLGQGIEYMGEVSSTISDRSISPLWLNSNRNGLSSTEGCSGYLRGSIERNINLDADRMWKVGYGADIVVPVNHTANFFVHQLYGQLQYDKYRLTIGSKVFDEEFTNSELSSGDLTSSNNARPIPQVRIELPDYWTVPGTDGWLGIKLQLSYGWFTDNNWQEDFTQKKTLYSANSLFHQKALFIKVGDEERFPLTFNGGLEFASQFGGEAWNVSKRLDDTSDFTGEHIKMNSGLKGYMNILFMGGSDANDGDYKNAEGNHVGSWHGSLKYHGKGWSVRGYFEHFFEDHSQLFFQYGWKDMMWGIEAQLPKNPLASNVVVEYLNTTDQTGGLYHDATDNLPVQISGMDCYYNHHIYGSWQHWGQAIGNPLLVSPIYNNNGILEFFHNRIKAFHLGVSGGPTEDIHYRLLYSHVKSWGTYYHPLTNPQRDRFLLAELTYKSPRYKGWSITGSLGVNSGDIIKNSIGTMFTLRKTGILNLK
ncbi:MAG: capsule assembly Wzi family protein [Bacteroidaceae bacterium]|nr:capsule assembly Wzi family protein [Bacteroidaceae bacterium]